MHCRQKKGENKVERERASALLGSSAFTQGDGFCALHPTRFASKAKQSKSKSNSKSKSKIKASKCLLASERPVSVT